MGEVGALKNKKKTWRIVNKVINYHNNICWKWQDRSSFFLFFPIKWIIIAYGSSVVRKYNCKIHCTCLVLYHVPHIPVLCFWNFPHMFRSPNSRASIHDPIKLKWHKIHNCFPTWKAIILSLIFSYAIRNQLSKRNSLCLVKFQKFWEYTCYFILVRAATSSGGSFWSFFDELMM